MARLHIDYQLDAHGEPYLEIETVDTDGNGQHLVVTAGHFAVGRPEIERVELDPRTVEAAQQLNGGPEATNSSAWQS